MVANKKSIATSGIYLRNLRTIINQAIDVGFSPREHYPFTKSKYQIPSAINTKKATTISITDIGVAKK
ncbi:hypothetical protein [uncultured Draconibacterium sp.]|uniref:hypothetical protein n=1 Tax=uncultured Draconibacterium sp. TaxID=1573823 RepID=UPI003749CB12